MTEQQHVVRIDVLEKAIETLIHDHRVPERLRTALAVYQNQRTGLNTRGLSLLPAKSSGLSKGSGCVADVCQPDKSRSSSNDHGTIRSRVRTTIRPEIEIQMWLDDVSLD